MTKSQLIEQLAAQNGMTRSHMEEVINSFFKMIYDQIRAGNKVVLSGFGSFSAVRRESRPGYNPQTGQKLTIPSRFAPKFKSGLAFRSAMKKAD